MYMVPIVVGWEHFPESKGLVTGIIMSAFGFGSFIYSMIARVIINPDNKLPDVDSGKRDLFYFDEEISMRVPKMFRELCIIWAVQIVIAVVLIEKPAKDEVQEADLLRDETAETL